VALTTCQQWHSSDPALALLAARLTSTHHILLSIRAPSRPHCQGSVHHPPPGSAQDLTRRAWRSSVRSFVSCPWRAARASIQEHKGVNSQRPQTPVSFRREARPQLRPCSRHNSRARYSRRSGDAPATAGPDRQKSSTVGNLRAAAPHQIRPNSTPQTPHWRVR
jgi:hypothetical protein